MKIKTLSLEGYVKREAKDGYATALVAPSGPEDPRGVIVQEYVTPDLYPSDTRVNVATGMISRPTSLKGYGLLPHSGNLCHCREEYVIYSIPELNQLLANIR